MNSIRLGLLVQRLALFFLLIGALYVLSFRLGDTSLRPWDEAWYASIARNALRATNPLELTFNGKVFFDHPPLGFYAIATSFAILGVNELSARLPMVIFALLTIVVLWQIGRKLSDSRIGLMAGLILISSRWYLVRARTANLESLLLLTQTLVFYYAYNAKDKWAYVKLWFFFALSLLSKTTISVTLLPLVLIATYRGIKEKKFDFKTTMLSFLLPLIPWYGYNIIKYGKEFINQNILNIGLRGGTASGVTFENTEKILLYLRSAVHKWYLPLWGSIVVSVIFLLKRPIRWLLAYLFLVGFPYFLSTKTEVWHLLPIIPPMALIIPTVSFLLIDKLARPKFINSLVKNIFVVGMLFIAFTSIRSFWYEFITERGISDEARLGAAAAKIDAPLILQDITFLPTVVFYADKKEEIKGTFRDPLAIDGIKRPFQLITREFILKQTKGYRIIEQHGDLVLALYE
ncbi:glycosyltransferase family 39 protein [Candidatus Woesebacteria bacterium]|nr:glycosyltransferase family 39 protein [Candidatus Woesebacteria bacterium]